MNRDSQLDLDRKIISINQSMNLAGVSRRTIYNWIKAGKVEYIRTVGGSIRIYADSLFRKGKQPNEKSDTESAAA